MAFDGHAPSASSPNFGVTFGHSMRRILIDRAVMVAEVHLAENIHIPFLDSLPAKNGSSIRHKYRVLREECGEGSGVIVVQSVVYFFIERNKRLAQLWIGRVVLLGKGGRATLIASPTSVTSRRIFIASSGVIKKCFFL